MSKFDKRLDEMLVVLNAVKKPVVKKKEEDDKAFAVDPVSSAMNDALGRFGMSVVDDKPEPEPEEEEDPIEGSIEDMEDLDLPRPADDADDEPASDDDEGDENGVGAPIDGEEDHSQDFNFMDVGNPVDTKPTDTDNFKDDGEGDVSGEGKVKFEFCPGKGVVLGIGDAEVTLSKEQVDTVKQFLSTLPEDFEAEDEPEETPFGNQDDDSEDSEEGGSNDDSEEDESDDKEFGEARFDDPNPPTKKCRCGGTMNYDKHNQQYKCPKCHAWERGKSSL